MPSGRRSSLSWGASDAAGLPSLLVAAACALGVAQAQTTSGEGTPIVPTATEADFAARRRAGRLRLHRPGLCRARRGDRRACDRGRQFLRRRRSPQARRASRTAFAATVTAWAGVDFLRFGPMAQEGRYERFAFFPDVHGTGARQISGFLVSQDEKLLKPGRARRARAPPCRACRRWNRCSSPARPRCCSRRRRSRSAARSRPQSPRTCKAIADEALAGWQGDEQLGGAYREPGRRQSRLPHACGGDDRNPEGDPDRPRAGARPPARAGARRDAGRGQGEPRALQRVGRRRSPISPHRRMRCSASSASPAFSTCCRPSQSSYAQFGRTSSSPTWTRALAAAGPDLEGGARRSAAPRQAHLCGDRAAKPARPLPEADRSVGRALARLQFARRRLRHDRRSPLAARRRGRGARRRPRAAAGGGACGERSAVPRAGEARGRQLRRHDLRRARRSHPRDRAAGARPRPRGAPRRADAPSPSRGGPALRGRLRHFRAHRAAGLRRAAGPALLRPRRLFGGRKAAFRDRERFRRRRRA